MGFFSGLFGSNSQWDGSRYVEKIAGTKIWHQHFIDKDAMKVYGQRIAHEFDPFGPRLRKQSIETIVGELIFLLQETKNQNDIEGTKWVVKAINHLLEHYEDRLPAYAQMKFIAEGYLDQV